MKTRFLMLLAALLLGTASAFAQSGNNEPLKGDVNGDGKVDVADITAVIKIMKDGGGTSEETKCYYYVGTEKPTSLSQASVVESYPAEQTFTNPSTTEKCYVYVLTKADMTVNFYDPSDLSTAATKTEDTSSISGYKITNMNVRVGKGGSIIIRISPTYYWYAGFGDTPTSVNTSNIKTSASEVGWHYFTAGTTSLHVGELSNNTKVFWFVLVPESSGLKNVVDAGEVLGGYTNSTVTIGGIPYTKITQDDATKKFDYDITN